MVRTLTTYSSVMGYNRIFLNDRKSVRGCLILGSSLRLWFPGAYAGRDPCRKAESTFLWLNWSCLLWEFSRLVSIGYLILTLRGLGTRCFLHLEACLHRFSQDMVPLLAYGLKWQYFCCITIRLGVLVSFSVIFSKSRSESSWARNTWSQRLVLCSVPKSDPRAVPQRQDSYIKYCHSAVEGREGT